MVVHRVVTPLAFPVRGEQFKLRWIKLKAETVEVHL